MYPTIAIIITDTSATPILRPISVVLGFVFSVDGLSVKRGTIIGETIWAIGVEDWGWTTAVEDWDWTMTVGDGDEAVVVDDEGSSVAQSEKMILT